METVEERSAGVFVVVTAIAFDVVVEWTGEQIVEFDEGN